MDTIFEQFFLQNSFPWSKIQLKAKSVRARKHFKALVCILKIFSNGKKCAMHKYSQALMCIFVHISHFFLTNCYGYHFCIVFTEEFIPMVKNTINSKKCALAQAFLGTLVHFSSYFPLFFNWLVMDTIFEQFLTMTLTFCFSKAKSKAIGCSCTFRTMGMNSPAKTIHIHKQPIEKSEKSEQKST